MYAEKKGGSHKMARPQQNWGLPSLCWLGEPVFELCQNTASPKSEPLSVWVRLSIFSVILSIIQYMGLCVFSLPISLVMIERLYILCLIIIIKSEVWTIIHCLGLGHETMVCAVYLYILLNDTNNGSSYNIFFNIWAYHLQHCGLDNMAIILHMMFSNTLSWKILNSGSNFT